MPVLVAPDAPQAVTKEPNKSTATKIAKQFLRDNSTAESAAKGINQSGWNKQFRAQHQDNFDMDQPRYRQSDDYAEKAQDGRYLVIIKHPENK